MHTENARKRDETETEREREGERERDSDNMWTKIPELENFLTLPLM